MSTFVKVMLVGTAILAVASGCALLLSAPDVVLLVLAAVTMCWTYATGAAVFWESVWGQ